LIKEAPSVILSKEEHLKWTKELRKALRYGKGWEPWEVWEVYKDFYGKYFPQGLREIERWFKRHFPGIVK
jgi:hypothetical protein